MATSAPTSAVETAAAAAAGSAGAADESTLPLPEAAVLIAQGAEARVYEMEFLGQPTIVKERFHKKYRHPVLDTKLTRGRLLAEARCLWRCHKLGIGAPYVRWVDEVESRLFLSKIDGITVRQFIDTTSDATARAEVAAKIGEAIATLHEKGNTVHGDLTTSNMMLRSSDQALMLLDFGLANASATVEDKAVDLYVLERAFNSTHPDADDMFKLVLEAYGAAAAPQTRQTLKHLGRVRARGRKKLAFG